jgi:amino acid transporter
MKEIQSELNEQSSPSLRRVLGFPDLTLLLIAALVNLNSVPVIAGSGPAAIILWGLGFIFFFVPQGIAVLELSRRHPEEGGIYKWNRAALGNFHGFLSGWCYWTNIIVYVPTLIIYIVGFASYIGGAPVSGGNSFQMVIFSLVLLWLITGLNIRGFGYGKWIQNAGAIGTFITAGIVFTIGFIALQKQGPVNEFSAQTILPTFTDWKLYSALSVVCLNYVGLELGSVLGDEIKNPRRNLPRAVFIAGASTFILYMIATYALQATLPIGEISVIDGILKAVDRAASTIHAGWLVTPIALLMSINAAGNTSAWISGSSRIPFVIGIDRYLPSVLGKIHSRFNTPHVALIVQALASSFFLLVASFESSIHDMYLILLQATIILTLIPYVYMFLALIKMQYMQHENSGYFKRRTIPVVGGSIGILMTVMGIIFAFIPATDSSNAWSFELKLLICTFSFIVPAFFIYGFYHRRIKPVV